MMTDGRQLLEAYLNGEALDDAERAALSDWVCATPDNARLAAELTHLSATLGELARARSLGPLVGIEEDDVSSQLLAKLSRLEAEASAELVHLEPQNQPWATTRWASWGAVAAAVTFAALLGAVLYVTQGASGSNNELASAPAMPATPPAAKPPGATTEDRTAEERTVATLTAAHGARWELDPIRVGEALKPGRVLILTDGFAQITTNRGAVAILQAPATIELLDSDNVIRLHTGKLVGICETDSSKGFLVLTPHMDITDLGTRFGVDATQADITDVHVFSGEVGVASTIPNTPDAHKPRRLTAGQSARADATHSAITTVDHDPSRFAAITPVSIALPGTGMGLAVGEIDPNWQLISENGQPTTGREAMSVTDAPGLVARVANDPAQAQWLIAQPTIAPPVGQPISYGMQTTFEVPDSIDPASARLVIDCVVDNGLAAVEINGHRLAIDRQEDAELHAELHAVSLVIQDHLRPGTNTLRFLVINVGSTTKGNRPIFTPDGVLSNNHVGLRLTWALHGTTTLFRQ